MDKKTRRWLTAITFIVLYLFFAVTMKVSYYRFVGPDTSEWVVYLASFIVSILPATTFTAYIQLNFK